MYTSRGCGGRVGEALYMLAGGYRSQGKYPRQSAPNAPVGPCYDCNGGYRPQGGYPRQSASARPNAPVGPCYECNGPHLVKDCPIRKEKRDGSCCEWGQWTNCGGIMQWAVV